MKLFASLLAALALLAGFAGGMRAYSASADATSASAQRVTPHLPKAQPVRPGVVFRYAPCRKPAVREGKACVTHVTRTVALPAPAAAAPAAPATRAQVRATAHAHAAPAYHDDGGHDGGGHDD